MNQQKNHPANQPTDPTQTTRDTWSQLHNEVITCRACPRLVEWREQTAREKRRAYQAWDYWGKPVPGFGDPHARLLLVGLAPGAHGSNRTGRVFTGDSSGVTLYGALYRAGFANQPEATHRGDGLKLIDTYITAVGRCAPPQNRPTRAELDTCFPYLIREWDLLGQVKVVLALGQIGFDGCVRLLRQAGFEVPRLKFGHGHHTPLTSAEGERTVHLLASYHPSRQNTQTGRLTETMLNDVFSLARSLL